MKKYIFLAGIIIFFGGILISENLTQDRKDIKIIENQAKPIYGELKLQFKENIFFEEAMENNLIFRSIRDIGLNSKGELAVNTWDRVFLLGKRGKYLKDIAIKGPGPGEITLASAIFIDIHDNIYLQDIYKMHIYNKNGKFQRHIVFQPTFSHVLPRFYVSPTGELFAFGKTYSKEGRIRSLEKRDKNGKLIKQILGFRDKSFQRITGKITATTYHEYMEDYYMTPVLDKEICFGKNLDYKLYFCDLNGNLTRIIKIDEKPQEISSQELEQFKKRHGKSEFKELIFPNHRPFFQGLLSDEMGRIYAIRTKPILEKRKERTVDIFGRNGRFLYRTYIPCYPLVIKNGVIYFKARGLDEQLQIKRLIISLYSKIKNK